MKIAFINSFYSPKDLGGAEIVVQNLAEGLLSIGHDVKVYTLDVKDETSKVNDVVVCRFKFNFEGSPFNKNINRGFFNKIKWQKDKIYNPTISKKISKKIASFNPDIINIHNVSGISPLIFKRLKLDCPDIPIVSTLHDYWPICYRNTLLDKNHNIIKKLNLINTLRKRIIEYFFQYVDAIVSPSTFLSNTIQSFTNIQQNLFHVISNGISTEVVGELNNSNQNINFLFLGQLEQHKGIHTLIDAINNVKSKNCKFNVAGSGKLSQYVQQHKKINYLGHISGEKKKEVLRNNDVLIMPSEWPEVFGLVIIEAFQSGMAVIASNIGGPSELVTDMEDGLLYEMGNTKELVEKIEFICQNPTQLNLFKSNAFKKGNLYTLEKMINKYELFFLTLIKSK